jgi:hypothetical protein
MWARGVVVVCVAGCGFTAPDAQNAGSDGAIAPIDVRGDSSFDAPPDGPPITIEFVQGDGMVTGDSDEIDLDYPQNQVAGDLDLITVNWANTAVSVGSVTDDAGNSYTLVTPTVVESNETLALYYATNIRAGSNKVMVTFDGGKGGAPELKVAEYSGIDNAQPIDVVSTNSAPGGTTADSGPLTTTHWHDVLIAAVTTQSSTSGHDAAYAADVQVAGDLLERREVTALGTYHATAPLDGPQFWLAELVAFRAAQ